MNIGGAIKKKQKMIDILKRDFPELNITDWCTRKNLKIHITTEY